MATLACAAGLSTTSLPTGAQVAAGSVSMSQQGNALTIQQTSQKAIVNWNSFSIGSAASVNIIQPNAQSIQLDRVVTNNPSLLMGKLNSNGQVMLVNPNGIVFGSNGEVTATAFTASTLGISDSDFLAGQMNFNRQGSTHAIVLEKGSKINTSATPNGYVALLATHINNSGSISTNHGAVVMAAGEQIKLPQDMAIPLSSKVQLQITPALVKTSLINNPDSLMVTQGGQVLMQSASLVDAISTVAGVIDTSGSQGGAVQVLSAQGQIVVNGTIVASSTQAGHVGGEIRIGRDVQTGELSAMTNVSGASLTSNNGLIETSGEVLVTQGIKSVVGAQWLLDPTDVVISNATTTALASGNTYSANGSSTISYVNNATISTALSHGTNVTVTTTTGNISLNSNVTDTAAAGVSSTLSLVAGGNITLNANVISSAAKLNVNLTAGGSISGAGNVTSNGNLTLNAAASGNYSGTVQLNGGTLVNLGTATQTLSGFITGNTAVLQNSTGVLYLSGSNNFMAGATVNNGVIQLGNRNGVGIGAVYINSGGTLDINGNGVLWNSNIYVSGNGYNGQGALISSANAVYTNCYGNVVLVGNASIGGDYGIFRLYNAVTGTGSLIKVGTDTLALTGNNSYTGITAVTSGTLQVWGNNTVTGNTYIYNHATYGNASPTALGRSNVTVYGGGTLNLYGQSTSNNVTFIGTDPSNPALLTTTFGGTYYASGQLTFVGYGAVGGSAGNIVLNGTLSGAGGWAKTGSDTVTVTASNTYSGGTTLAGGTVLITNAQALGTGAVDVMSGATLDVNGQSIANQLVLAGTGVSQNGALTSSANQSITLSGDLSLSADASIVSNGAINLSGVVNTQGFGLLVNNAQSLMATNANNQIATLAVGNVGNVTVLNNGAMTLGSVAGVNGINSHGVINIATTTGDLDVIGSVSTSNASANAVTLNAGAHIAAGYSDSGNIVMSAGATISTGSGGRILFYTGSIANSTGLNQIVPVGNSRYDSNATTVNYTQTLGAQGAYAIYREQPVVTVTANSMSQTLTGQPFSGGNGVTYSGWVNGDGVNSLSGQLQWGGSAQGARAVGSYSLVANGLVSTLGYRVQYASGALTINELPASATPVIPAPVIPVINSGVKLGSTQANTFNPATLSLALDGFECGWEEFGLGQKLIQVYRDIGCEKPHSRDPLVFENLSML